MSAEPAKKMVTFKFNGKDVTVPDGFTVMQAAQQEKIDIPYFCWHPGLPVAGVCRFCMVKVEGARKLEISCNLPARDGMVVTSVDDEVVKAHKWALEFHLVNHPLDCPICDQAGECGLQDFYMKVGKYQSEMDRPKVLKPKALEIGNDLVLDTERCILCDRCVRFEEEVTKTSALGIFDRGDRAIVGTYPGKKIEHNYTTNLVDICPVGAFTSKDFRFKQRVWFLEDKPAVCPGCSTGCHVDVYGKVETRKFFRLKPRHSEVNSYWMCNTGRHMYEHLNKEHRLLYAMDTEVDEPRKKTTTEHAIESLAMKIANTSPADIALLVSAQYTCEEYQAVFDFFVKKLGVKKVYQWREGTEKVTDFDGLLYRGDHNPNTTGLLKALKENALPAELKNDFQAVASSGAKVVIALAPEIPMTFPSLAQQFKNLSELPYVSLWTMNNQAMGYGFSQLIPTKGFAEKTGTFLNFEGKEGKLEKPFPAVVKTAMAVDEIMNCLTTKYQSITTA